jgi:hypothetical protein
MKNETVIIFKDKKSREIQTYINLDGHGARLSVHDFISLVCEQYGSPVSTFKRVTHLEKMIDSAHKVIKDIKEKTREIAAVNIEPPKESKNQL